MSRDQMIVLLVLGLAANVALLAAVAWLNNRAAMRTRAEGVIDPGAPVSADDTDPARLMTIGAGLVDPEWIDAAIRPAESGPSAPFLGEPVAPDPEARAGRRRHRARRPAGMPAPRTDLVLSLAGSSPEPRIVHALSAALRGTVRGSDEVVELPGGRVRVTLETDARGGEAFVSRARSVVAPWLTALDPALDLRVERPRTPASTTATKTPKTPTRERAAVP